MIIHKLVKNYGSKEVLNIDTLDLREKGIIGLIGVNGSGKTTLFKCLGRYLQSRVELNQKVKISYFPDMEHFFRVKISYYIEILLASYSDFNKTTFLEVLEEAKIDSNRTIKSLSRGEKIILNLATTISRDTDMYLIDELFSNIDFESRELITELIVKYVNVKEKTIIISSHEIDDVERILDYAMVLHNRDVSKIETINNILLEHGSMLKWFEHKVGVN